MNKAIKKFAILAGIFLAAAGIYFFTSLNNMEQSETVYTVMDAPELPVIEAELFEDQANRLVGYRMSCPRNKIEPSSGVRR